MKIKDFNDIFRPIMCIKAFCLYFDKAGITDFEIIFKKYFQRKIFIFFHCNRKKSFKIFGRKVIAFFFFFTLVLLQRLAILAVSFKDKGKNSQSFPSIAG